MPRLVIDARYVRPEMTGVGVWAFEMTRAIARLARSRGDWETAAITLSPSVLRARSERSDSHTWKDAQEHIEREWASIPGLRRYFTVYDYEDHPGGDVWYHGGGLGKLLRRARADLFFSPSFLCPWSAPCPCISTLLDFIAWRYPATYPMGFRHYVRWMMRISARRADGLIVISRSAGLDARAILKVPSRKLRLIYPGVGREFRPIPEGERLMVKEFYGLPEEPYFLWLGNLEPRKGMSVLLRAFEQLRSEGEKASLAVIGRVAPGGEADAHLLAQSPYRSSIWWRGDLPRAVAAAVMGGATGLIFPSRYEGFGLPVLEAMACGIPVAARKIASLPEVLGDAGVLLSPGKERQWVDVMRNWLKNPEERKELGRRGIIRSSEFTWDRSAQTFLDYADALKRRKRVQSSF